MATTSPLYSDFLIPEDGSPPLHWKTPYAIKDFEFDWGQFIPDGDSISIYTVAVPSGITKVTDSKDASGRIIQYVLSGGTDGADYPVTCNMTTVAGLRDEQTMIIQCRTR